MCARLPNGYSETLAWIVLAGLLGIGLPLFVCSPPWVDTTYHDCSAWNVMHGGVHYKDVFETNLPGMVWLHCFVRRLFGWSFEAIRIADLFVVGSAVCLLAAWPRPGELARARRVWYLAAAALFYVFQGEFAQVQRDGWMLLPTVIALCLRRRQVEAAAEGRPGTWSRGFGEGIVWGCAVWIKPHALVPALLVWLVSQPRLRGVRGRDVLGLVGGGTLVGAAGMAWVVGSGALAPMWDVFTNWNPEYYKWDMEEASVRVQRLFMYFPLFSLAHFVALPLAAWAVFKGLLTWEANGAFDRSLLSALYLGWAVEATFLQKGFDYVHAPVVLLALAVLAVHRLPVGPVAVGWVLIAGAAWHTAERVPSVMNEMMELCAARPNTFDAALPYSQLVNERRLVLWPRCFRDGATSELMDELSAYPKVHCVPTWTELDEVAAFLRCAAWATRTWSAGTTRRTRCT